MKKKIFSIVFAVCICLIGLILPFTPILYGFFAEAQFTETYYGELSDMYRKLSSAQGKKIVFIGTSGIAFGVNSRQIETDLKEMGAEYTVCNFGLYGALGTKLMLDLSEDYISEGDIVVVMPELEAQELTLYFSAEHVWRAMDGDFSMLSGVKSENRSAMVGGFAQFVSEKYEAAQEGGKTAEEGVYRKSSFDENCDMSYARGYNAMLGGADANFPIRFSEELIAEDFIEYLNAYNALTAERGATVYFSYPAMNAAGIESDDLSADLLTFNTFLREKLDFKIISDPHDCVMEKEWFYDSNFHLNSSGAVVNSHRLTREILNELSLSAEYSYVDPEMPPMPENNGQIEGNFDNAFADFFEYEEKDGGYRIVALKEAGKALDEIVVPYSYDGKVITSFAAETFNGCAALKKIILQKNIRTIADNSFVGCTALESLVLQDFAPTNCSVGFYLFEEESTCKVYVSEKYYRDYLGDYFWSHYAERLRKSA